MKRILFTFALTLFALSSLAGSPSKPAYYVAAYIWPSCHNEARSQQLWPDGIGEWEVIKKGNPRFEGHYQPKVPLWGYEMDDNPKVMEKWIDAASSHHVNVFIFDWYWYDGAPLLESTLDNGFLKANNRDKMQFYIMWANHDVIKNYWNVHHFKDDNSILWTGKTDWENYKKIVSHVIKDYFKQPNYFKIDGKPVISVYKLANLIATFGNITEARKGLDYFRDEVKKAGFPGLHIQQIADAPTQALYDQAKALGLDSFTEYNWGGPHPQDYIQWASRGTGRYAQWEKYDIPYFPNVAIGWDNTPRFPKVGKEDVIHYNNTPQSFAAFLLRAKQYADAHPQQTKLITIYAFNEWVEGAYLLPDAKYGYGYLEAVRDVMTGKFK